jgi:hypothetical protein
VRKRARKDDNQTIIVSAFRQFGASVFETHQIGGGFPDIVVGFRGKNYLIEIKDGEKCESRRPLTPAEIEFHATWHGRVEIIKSVEEVTAFMRRGSCDR